MTTDPAELAMALPHVLWIGGATDSGKTSVARALAGKYRLQEYHYDLYDHLTPPGHWARIDPVRQPHMSASSIRDRNRMWVDTTPEELVEKWLRTTPERFQLTLEDLLALPSSPKIVAEGYGFAPDLVRPLLTSPRQAVWLVSDEEFKRATYDRRGKGGFSDTRNPDRARRNHVGRDLLLAQYVRERAEAHGLAIIDVNMARTLDYVVTLVEAQFEPFLGAGPALIVN